MHRGRGGVLRVDRLSTNERHTARFREQEQINTFHYLLYMYPKTSVWRACKEERVHAKQRNMACMCERKECVIVIIGVARVKSESEGMSYGHLCEGMT